MEINIKNHLIQEGILDHIKENKKKYLAGGAAAALGGLGYNGLLGRKFQVGIKKLLPGQVGSRIKDDYNDGTISSFGDSIIGDSLTGGAGTPATGIYQGLRTGHPVVGALFGKAGTLGAASNNVDGINVKDSFNVPNVVGNYGIGAPVTALKYGLGKTFGSKEDLDYYTDKMDDAGI